ncbi:MAG: hypothetical protein HC861_03355 [Rhodospirillaceae bacterium]|nr:hypothetical protein [Rhodospirillaceae bacterium]
MWTQLIEADALARTGSSMAPEPNPVLVERVRRHAEWLAHPTRLRAARRAHA